MCYVLCLGAGSQWMADGGWRMADGVASPPTARCCSSQWQNLLMGFKKAGDQPLLHPDGSGLGSPFARRPSSHIRGTSECSVLSSES
jgi:hypothetical protein